MTDLLSTVANAFKNGRELMGSKWGNCETEVIATQAICACQKNKTDHGDAFSWLSQTATHGRDAGCVDNRQGLTRLIREGAITVENYCGELLPPADVHCRDGKPRILRVTDELLLYAAKHMKLQSDR